MGIKLSVIISCYNQAVFLSECVNSVLDQSLKDIEIIIVDDGSTDDSEKLGRNYQEMYPHIQYIKQDNKGVSGARNTGLKRASGEYVTFLDGDDYVNHDYYQKLYDAGNNENADTIIGNIRCFNDFRTWNIGYMKKVFNQKLPKTRHIKQYPELHLTPSVCNKLFKRSLLTEHDIMFNEQLYIGEDLLFTQKSLFLSNKTVIVNSDGLNYRFNENEASLTKSSDVQYFYQLLVLQQHINDLYQKLHVMEYLKEIEQRQVQFFIDSFFNKARFFSKNQFSEFMQIGGAFFKEIQNDFFHLLKPKEKLLIEILLNEDEQYFTQFVDFFSDDAGDYEHICLNDKYYSFLVKQFGNYKDALEIKDFKVEHKIETVNLIDSKLQLAGYAFINGISAENNQMFLSFENGQQYKKVELENCLRTDVSYLFSKNRINYHNSGFKLDSVDLCDLLTDGNWKVNLHIETRELQLKVPVQINLAQIRNRLKPIYSKGKEIRPIYMNGTDLTFHIQKATKRVKAKGLIKQIIRNVKYDFSFLKSKDYQTFSAIILYRLTGSYLRKKDIWLIGERKDTAQDNSYHLFKYIRTHEPNVNIQYVIDKDSSDYQQIKSFGKIVSFGSLKHTLYLLTCSKSINSYVETANMYTDSYKKIIKYYPEWQQNEKIFIQHGVIGVSRVNHVLHKNRMDYSMFVVSSQFEKDHLMKEFGYKDEEVAVTGLARWDALQDLSNGNEILLMPTWRSWIKSKAQLEQSEYYQTYIDLLKDERLHKILEEKDLKLTFFPHYQTQKLLRDKLPFFHDRIRIVRQGEESVQHLLKSHRLLITDYSTVSFDFAYMKKPVLFYQFDYDEFYSKHYNEGPIDVRNELASVSGKEKDSLLYLLSSTFNTSHKKHNNSQPFSKYVERFEGQHSKKIFERINSVGE